MFLTESRVMSILFHRISVERMLMKVIVIIASTHFQNRGLLKQRRCTLIYFIWFQPMAKSMECEVITLLELFRLQQKHLPMVANSDHVRIPDTVELYLNLLMNLRVILRVVIFIWQHVTKM